MPKSYADEQKRKKDEEERQQAEQKVVGQQQKTQPEANKPTGSTSIPTTPAKEQARAEQRQREQQRLENKTPERQARVNYNRQQQAQTSTRDTENAKVQNRNERRENTVNRNVTQRQAYTDTNSNNRDLRSNAQRAADRKIDRIVPGYSRSMGAANSQYAPNRQTSQRTQSIMQNYGGNGQTVGGGTIQRLPSPSDLPDAVGSSANQLDLSRYTFGKPSDFSGATIGSRKNAEDDLYNILHGNKREALKESARNDSNTLSSLLAGAGSGALGTLGDLAGISEKYFKGKPNDYEGMTPDDIYNRAVETANGMNLLNYNNATLGSDYDAYKEYILNQMETGDITNDEINKMMNLEKLYSEKIPAKGLKELGADARAINEGFAEKNPIANFAGNMAPMVLANGALSALGVGSEALAAADKINNPALKFLAKQGVNLIPDLITDTGSEMVRNINEGKSKEEIAKDAALNVLMNAGANVAFDYAPKGIKAIADRVNGSNVAKQAAEDVAERVAKEAAPNLAEQTIKGMTNPYSNVADDIIQPGTIDDVFGNNIAPEIDEIGSFTLGGAPRNTDNLIRNNGFRNILRDNEYSKLVDIGGAQGPLDDALSNVIRSVESGDKAAYETAMGQYRQLAEASGIDADRILNRLDRYVTGEISEDLDTELVNSITQNIDVIDAELKKLDAIGVPPTQNGSDWLTAAHEALDDYEKAVFEGGDVTTATDNLNKALGNLDRQAKKLEGYDGAFSAWKGGGTARGDLYSNSSRIPGYGKTEWTDDMIDELSKEDYNYHARPANNIPNADDYGLQFTPGDYKDAIKAKQISRQDVISKTTPEFQDVLRRLSNNEAVTREELMNLPEVKYAEARMRKGDSLKEFEANPTAERKAMQQKLADDYYNRGSAVIDESGKVNYNGDVERGKKVFFVTGLPASGKSSTLVDRISQNFHARVLDSDDIKYAHKDFDNGFGGNYIHNECKKILGDVTDKAIKNGENMVIPIIGGDNPKKLADKIKAFQDKGWEVSLCQNDLPSNKALGRAMSRYITDGRYIPPKVLMDYADTPHRNYLEMIERGRKYGVKELSGFARVDNDVAEGSKAITREYGGNLSELFGGEGTRSAGRNGGLVLEERGGDGAGLHSHLTESPGKGKHSYNEGAFSNENNASSIPNGSQLPNASTDIPDLGSSTPKKPVDRGPGGRIVDTNDVKERGYAKSTRNNPDIPDEVAAEFVENPEIYNVLHNKDTKAKAQSILDQGFDKAYADYKDLLNKKDAAAIPLGYDLAKQMIDKGDSSGAADLIRDMSKSLTESGQFSQAAAITLMRNDPMTALKYAQKEMDKLNVEGAKKFKNWKNFELTDDEIKAFSKLEAGDKEGISNLFDQIGVRLGKEYPTTAMEKLLEARRIGMLFNVRTNVRNFGANVPTLGMRWASDRVDAVGQNIAHLINPNFKVTQSLTGSGKQGRKLATEIFNSDRVQNLLKGTDGKYTDSIKGALVKEKQMYKGTALDHWIDKVTGNGLQRLNEKAFGKKGVQSIPETLRNATYKALDLGDSPFVKENFIERLGSYIKAQGYKSIDDVPDEAVETAWEAAMKATYKDQSWAYKMIRDIKAGIGQAGKAGKVASESLIPFVQAPGNIAARMVDYSPIGAANGAKNIIKGAKSGSEKAVREGINQLAQGATGTLALGIGVALYNSGLITGAYSQDKDKKAHEKNNGYREYALHIGDHYYTIDWAQPAFQTIMNGVVLADAIKKSDEYDSDMLKYFGVENSTAGKVIGAAKQAGKTSLNSWFNASPLQSMQDLLGGTYEDSSDIASKLWSVAGENFAGSYIPASVNAVAKTMDTTQRQTYDPSNKTASFVNQQIAKIPGLSKTLPSKYNTWGEAIKTAGSTGEAAFNRFLNPGENTKENKKPIDGELDRLFDVTGNKQVYPQVAPNKVDNEALTARQVSELQKDMGERSLDAANKFMDSDVYQNMNDEQRAEGYADLYNTAKWAAQLKMTDPELYKQMQDGDSEALKTLSGTGASLKRKYITEGWDAVIDDIAYGQMKGQIDTDGSGSVNQDEILNFINDGHQDEAEKIWNKYKGNSNSQLQTDENGVYTLMDSKGKVKYGTGSMSDEEKAITNELDELGFTSDKAYEQYTKAQSVIPTLTTQEYADTYNSMDADKSNSINQKEMFAFFKSNNVTQEEANQYWQAYGNDWKTVPVLEGDEWKAKKGTIETAPEETAATDDYSGGSVDIHNRPLVPTSELKAAGWNDAGDGYATVFSSTYSNADGTDARNFTPIMVDDNGQYVQTVSPEFLDSYAQEVIDGKHNDYYGLQIGGSYSSIAEASKAAEQLHKDQEKEYGLAQKAQEEAAAEELPGAEELPSAEPVSDGGLNWALSNGYDLKNTKTYQRAVDAGVSDADFNTAWFAADADGNGYMKKAEAQNYVSGLPEEERDKWFHILYKGR